MTKTVAEVAERYRVSAPTVLKWIANGDLRPIKVGRSANGGKPRWMFTEKALADFEAKRTPGPAPVRTRRRKQAVERFY